MGEVKLQSISEVPAALARLEGYFVELLDKLERIASVMERFDNVMNPTLDLAEDALREQIEVQPPGMLFPSVFQEPTSQAG